MFTKLYNNNYSYVSVKEFDESIRTDTYEKQKCRINPTHKNKIVLPMYYFLSNVEGTVFTHMRNFGTSLIPNEALDYKNVQFTGLFCVDIDNVSDKEICLLKERCHLYDNCKYCAISCSGKGCFILYNVGKNNQSNSIYIYNNILPFISDNILKPVRKSLCADLITLSINTTRIESYDPDPYNNLGNLL